MKTKLFLIVISLLIFFDSNSQNTTSIGTKIEKNNFIKTSTNIFGEIAMLEIESNDLENGGLISENITSYILGVSSTIKLNKNFDLIGSIGFAEGFSFSFLNSNLALKFSDNFHLFYGIGTYYLSDERWNVQGLDGNEPSRFDFGMNLGLQLYLTDYFGIIVRYNIIEEKEAESIASMSLNGLSFGIILK